MALNGHGVNLKLLNFPQFFNNRNHCLCVFADVTFVPVSKLTGHVEVSDIVSAVRPMTCLVTIMHANNETGVIQVGGVLGEIGGSMVLSFSQHEYCNFICQ